MVGRSSPTLCSSNSDFFLIRSPGRRCETGEEIGGRELIDDPKFLFWAELSCALRVTKLGGCQGMLPALAGFGFSRRWKIWWASISDGHPQLSSFLRISRLSWCHQEDAASSRSFLLPGVGGDTGWARRNCLRWEKQEKWEK